MCGLGGQAGRGCRGVFVGAGKNMQELLGQAERVADQLSGELKMWDYVEGKDQESRWEGWDCQLGENAIYG